MLRVIDLEDETLSAANDAELARCIQEYYGKRGEERSDEEIERLVADEAYDAADS